MKVSDLTESETRVWEAAAIGTVVDLRVGNPELDSPEKWAAWETERTVRAEVIADLLIGDGEAASIPARGVHLQGARITGELNLEATTLRCPLALLDCSFAGEINLDEATAMSMRLSGSHVPTLRARQLRIRGGLWLDKGFSVSGGVDLAGACIGGQLSCTGAGGVMAGAMGGCGEPEVSWLGPWVAVVRLCTQHGSRGDPRCRAGWGE